MKKMITIFVCLAWSAALGQPRAYVVNNLAETLSRIDLETGQVQNHVVTLGETPNFIGLHSNYLYVLNSISANVQKIDPTTDAVVADIPLPIGSNPYSMAFADSFAYVSGWVSGRIYRVNLSSAQVQGEIEIGGYPEGMAFSGSRLYVTQTGFNPNDFSYGQGRMAVIDLDGFSLENEINVGKNPQAIVQTPDGRLHIVCTGNYIDVAGSVYVFDPIASAVVDSILIGGQPSSAALSRQGIVYLGAGGWVDNGYIFSYNSYTLEILHGPGNPITTGLGAYSVAIDSMGYLYSCDFGADSVTKLSGLGQFVARYGLGDGPQSIVILDTRISGIEDSPEGNLPEFSGFLGNYPNPFNGETIIKFMIHNYEGPAVVEIFDLAGRLVRKLRTGTVGGTGAVLWDGRDFKGDICASGQYFARLGVGIPDKSSRNGAWTLKLSLIK